MSSHKAMSPNQREGLTALSTITGKNEYLTSTSGILNSGATLTGSAIPATGLTSAAAVQIVDGSGNQITSFGGASVNANIFTNQKTSNTSAVQLIVTSTPLSNGVILQALSTNTASIFVGASGVTTSTGFELQAGQATSVAVNNLNLVYVVGSNSSDKICWIGN